MDREDIQSVVFHGYPAQGLVRYHLLHFGSGDAIGLLSRLVTDIASADEPPTPLRRQCALTATGLGELGLGGAELAQFAREFRQTMAHPERALALGHVARDSPELWEFGGPRTPRIDALWLTFAEHAADLAEGSARDEALFTRFGVSFQIQDAALSGQPRAPALRRERRFQSVPWGERVLGERDAIGDKIRGPFVAIKHSERPLPAWVRARNAQDLGKNGSYLVLRKLEQAQNVLWFATFHSDLRRQFELRQAEARLSCVPQARMRGGGYFFLPSVSALNYLAERRAMRGPKP